MKLSGLAFLACAGTAAAYPSYKTCTTQRGSASNGVPLAGGSFTAMGATWAKDFSNTVFDDTGGNLTIDVPNTNYGMFVIVSSGTLSVASASSSTYTSSCNDPCDRVLCLIGVDGSLEVDLSDSEGGTCADIDIVVGYATSKTSGNTLSFAKVNACDSNSISVSTYPTTTTTTAAETTAAAAETTAAAAETAAATVNGTTMTIDLDAASPTCVAATVLAGAAVALIATNVM
eukprot:INCI14881.1.p1 GENE.INCI14881.1~~INCI14881.1.p1  ORF type:complete len:231 (+),score=54.32 INCI14881.1:261-953(+)